MEFRLSRTDILDSLSRVVGILEKRHTLPILSHVLVSVRPDEVLLSGTDQEVELQASLDFSSGTIAVASEGSCAVPGRKLLDICRHLPGNAELDFSVTGRHLKLRSGAFESQFSLLPADEFPSLDGYENPTQEISLSSASLAEMFGKSTFAMAQQDVRYFFNGMLFELDGEKFKLVATNGQRLAVVASDSTGSHLEGRPIVPRKGVLELAKLLDGVDGDIKLSFSETCFVADMAGKRFISKLIDGEYPDYTKAIPSGADKLVVCDRQMLREAMVRTAVMSNEVYKNVKLSLKPGSLSLFTNNPLQEQAKESLAVDYSGEALEIGFNVHFLIEALGALTGGTVSMGFSGQTSPCLITDPEDPSTEFVVSPMVI